MVSVADFAKLTEATQKAAHEKNKNLKVDASEDVKPGKLHQVWAQCMGELGEYVGPMIAEDGGRLKTFIGKCPPGTAKVLVAFAVKEWVSFASILRKEYAVWNVSEKPVLGTMTKHADALVTFWMAREKAKAAKAAHKAGTGRQGSFGSYPTSQGRKTRPAAKISPSRPDPRPHHGPGEAFGAVRAGSGDLRDRIREGVVAEEARRGVPARLCN